MKVQTTSEELAKVTGIENLVQLLPKTIILNVEPLEEPAESYGRKCPYRNTDCPIDYPTESGEKPELMDLLPRPALNSYEESYENRQAINALIKHARYLEQEIKRSKEN